MSNHRSLQLEQLEERRLLSVSANNPALHVALPEEYTGVLRSINPEGTNFGGSVLLPTGRHLLTAAHVASEEGRTIETNLPAPSNLIQTLPNPEIHPEYTDPGISPDLAILELPFELPTSIERYDIYRGTNELGEVATRVGFGLSGEDKVVLGTAGPKRIGVNRYGDVQQQILKYDFDDDDPANVTDPLGDGAGIHGNDKFSEVLSAGGDSGSPAAFVDGKIAGISSLGINPGANGEETFAYNRVGVDSRVSYAADWIDTIIDEAGVPTITDVRLRGSSWAATVDIAFADLVTNGHQFRPIATQGVNRLDVTFSEHVLMDGSELELAHTGHDSGDVVDVLADGFSYDVTTHTATWTFDTDLSDGKYAIKLSDSITDTGGNRLDGEWDNSGNGTPDFYMDDPARSFAVDMGNGVAGVAINGAVTEGGDFRLHFALLAGDYDGNGIVEGQLEGESGDGNGDGIVDTADETIGTTGMLLPLYAFQGADFNDDELVGGQDLEIWQANYGLGTATQSDGDADGDGDVDGKDFLIWQGQVGDVGSGLSADFDGNEVVDGDDLAIWSQNYGMRPIGSEEGDANGNGAVEGSDFLVWQVRFADRSAWYVEPANGVAPIVENEAPRVTNVIMSGSNSTDDPYEFSSLVGTGEQLRSVPVNGIDTVSMQFSEEVGTTISASTLQIANLDGTSPSAVSEYIYDYDTQTATWRFENNFADGRHLLTLTNSPVDLDSESLDGEIQNPWSLVDTSTPSTASGDGAAGGEFRFRTTIMSGDTDHDNIDGAVDYTDWLSIEPGMILVSTETDELDSDYSVGDMSLREAVYEANLSQGLTTIVVPAGHYVLDRLGNELGDSTNNDLDITGDVAIAGAGAGITFIDNSALTGGDARAFDVSSTGSRLDLSRVTLRSGSGYNGVNGRAIRVSSDGELNLTDSAVVNHYTPYESAINIYSADATIRRSVFTNLDGYYNSGLAIDASGASASLTIGETIFAQNYIYNGVTTANVSATANVTKVNEGNNLYDDAAGGFFNTTPGTGDYIGTPDYIVTSVADTFDHTDNADALSLREAVDLANNAAGTSEIWAPAWQFILTRDRGSSVTDTDVSIGDLDIKSSLVIRGVTGETSVAWTTGVIDAVFDLLGDFTGDGISSQDDGDVDGGDFLVWQQQTGSTGGTYSADADDDGDVDGDDLNIWSTYQGNFLDLFDIVV